MRSGEPKVSAQISVTQKNVLFDLVAQLLDFALSEHGPLGPSWPGC